MNRVVQSRQRITQAVLVVLVAIACVVAFSAGLWQMRRASFKSHLQLRMTQQKELQPQEFTGFYARFLKAKQTSHIQTNDHSPKNFELLLQQPIGAFVNLPVQLTGYFLPSAWVAIDNRQVDGQPAVQIIQVFVTGRHHFLIDRGYLKRDPRYPRAMPALPETMVSGTVPVTIEGVLQPGVARSADLPKLFFWKEDEQPPVLAAGQVWQNFDAETFIELLTQEQPTVLNKVIWWDKQWVVRQVKPAMELEMTEQGAPGGVIDPNKHWAYAIQWFGLFGVSIIFLVYFFISRRLHIDEQR